MINFTELLYVVQYCISLYLYATGHCNKRYSILFYLIMFFPFLAELQNPPDGSENMVILCKIKLINIYVYGVLNINYTHQGTLMYYI